ncbi:hypothetical protein CDL12_04122 [Handroanthus impetiginosus]|uniref:Uncharacterized protein n=1 Tax=Handroanthus impetiginosus TaxID=429701 RepID=A0A2G9I073_9LAMI|nr:hypothetical protein CDL12_04122 [Handroanthus impetiginosus]
MGGASATMDPSTHTIVVENESVWGKYVKVHPEARSLKNKSQPMYNSWVEIFGTNRATGVGSIDVGNIVTEMLNEARALNVEPGANHTIRPPACSVREGAAEGVEYNALSIDAMSRSASKKKTNLLEKRKHSEDPAEAFESIMGTWMEDTKVVLGSIANQLNHPKQTQAETDSSRRAALFQALHELPVLLLDDRIKATRHLAHNNGDRDAFWKMDKETRSHFVMMLLGANFGSFDLSVDLFCCIVFSFI